MKLIVFGSTGATGIEVIRLALEKGYEVIAYARSPDKINIEHENLTIIKGELDDLNSLENAISKGDAVISLLGASGKVKDNSISNGVKNIVSLMEKHNLKRIIQVSTSASKDANDRRDLYFDFMVLLVRIAMPKVYSEIQLISEYLKESSLDWTIVRLPFLSDDPTGNLNIGYKGHGVVRKNLSRKDLADFLIQQIDDDKYIKKSPFISN